MNPTVPSPEHGVSAHEFRLVREMVNKMAKKEEERAKKEEERVKEMAKIVEKLAQLTVADGSRCTPSTNAERYHQLHKEKVPAPWFNLAKKSDIPRRLFMKDYPPEGASEVKVLQPHWTNNILPQLRKGRITLVDAHKKVSFGRRKPDIVGYISDKPQNTHYIGLIGEVKPRTGSDFSNEDKGHLESFLEELLLVYQPYRDQITGFLTDSCIIQFFRLVRTPTATLRFIEAPPFSLHDEGGQWLLGFLRSPPSSMKLCEPVIDGQHVIITNFLGLGGSAVVYSGKFQDEDVVVKRFNRKDGHLRSEAENLVKIMKLEKVPRLIAQADDELILLLQPIGMPFGCQLADCMEGRPLATGTDFCQLVDILKQAHEQCRMVHRDVRPNNFFRRQDSLEIFLNDWGAATEIGVACPFSGALQHAPNRILLAYQHRKDYEPRLQDDLEMVVRSVFQTVCMPIFQTIRNEQDADRLIKFWDYHLRPSSWANMVQAAQGGNYEALKAGIACLLPCTNQ